MAHNYSLQKYQSPVGLLYLVAVEDGLVAVVFASKWPLFEAHFPGLQELETAVLAVCRQQLDEYFAGDRHTFALPLRLLSGTSFQRKAWLALQTIPYGETRSYKEQAVAIQSAKAVRAVGSANRCNPLSIIIPCHRVIASDGSLAGYGGGLPAKQFLLAHEGEVCRRRSPS